MESRKAAGQKAGAAARLSFIPWGKQHSASLTQGEAELIVLLHKNHKPILILTFLFFCYTDDGKEFEQIEQL